MYRPPNLGNQLGMQSSLQPTMQHSNMQASMQPVTQQTTVGSLQHHQTATTGFVFHPPQLPPNPPTPPASTSSTPPASYAVSDTMPKRKPKLLYDESTGQHFYAMVNEGSQVAVVEPADGTSPFVPPVHIPKPTRVTQHVEQMKVETVKPKIPVTPPAGSDFIQAADGTLYQKYTPPSVTQSTPTSDVSSGGKAKGIVGKRLQYSETEDDDDGADQEMADESDESADDPESMFGMTVEQLIALPPKLLTEEQSDVRKKLMKRRNQAKYMGNRKQKGGDEFKRLLAARNRAQRKGEKLPSIKQELMSENEEEEEPKPKKAASQPRKGRSGSASGSASACGKTGKKVVAVKTGGKGGRGGGGGRGRGGRGRGGSKRQPRGSNVPTTLEFQSAGVNVRMDLGPNAGKQKKKDEVVVEQAETEDTDKSQDVSNSEIYMEWAADSTDCLKAIEEEIAKREAKEKAEKEKAEKKKKMITWEDFQKKVATMSSEELQKFLKGKQTDTDKEEETCPEKVKIKVEVDADYEPVSVLKATKIVDADTDNTYEEDQTCKDDNDGWRLVTLKSVPVEIRQITEETPHLSVYKQTWVRLDNRGERVVQWRKPKSLVVDLCEDVLKKQTDGTEDTDDDKSKQAEKETEKKEEIMEQEQTDEKQETTKEEKEVETEKHDENTDQNKGNEVGEKPQENKPVDGAKPDADPLSEEVEISKEKVAEREDDDDGSECYLRVKKGDSKTGFKWCPAKILSQAETFWEVNFYLQNEEKGGWVQNDVVHTIMRDDSYSRLGKPKEIKLSSKRVMYEFPDLDRPQPQLLSVLPKK